MAKVSHSAQYPNQELSQIAQPFTLKLHGYKFTQKFNGSPVRLITALRWLKSQADLISISLDWQENRHSEVKYERTPTS